MSDNNGAEHYEPPRKKLHVEEPSSDDSNRANAASTNQPLDLVSESTKKHNSDCAEEQAALEKVAAADFSKLEVVRVLSTVDSNCSVALEAKHATEEGRVLVHMQKIPFDREKISSLICGSTRLTQLFHNDVYSKHTATLPPELNEVQVTLVHPALDKHFKRYERELCSIVEETPELYRTMTKPFIESDASPSREWIYNILEGSSEADRIIHRDDDPRTGFVLVPDLKWTGLQMTDLYCQALVHRRDLSCLRDLTADHLPLLRNVLHAGMKAITARYGVQQERLRAYLHYLPSFYHLHVHFAALTFDAPGTWCGKAHLLRDVISNLEQDGDHYQKATISFTVRDNHPHPLAAHNRAKAQADTAQ